MHYNVIPLVLNSYRTKKKKKKKKKKICSSLLNIKKFILQETPQNFMEYISLKILPKKAVLEYTINIDL